jgi:septum formation protein
MFNPNITLYLASQSPRRRALLKELGYPVQIIAPPDIEEIYPETLKGGEIPLYLAKLKAEVITDPATSNGVLVTADTIVWLDNEVLGKPIDNADAIQMLTKLSGRMHQVFTGVCLKYKGEYHCFYDTTNVYFKSMTQEEVGYYVEQYQPTDKAGAYGVQEWIGFVGVDRIDGSYFNVMGLPTHRLYSELKELTGIHK